MRSSWIRNRRPKSTAVRKPWVWMRRAMSMAAWYDERCSKNTSRVRPNNMLGAGGAGGFACLLMLSALPLGAQQPRPQFPPSGPPRMADVHPDLNGVWQAFVTADWDLQNHDAQAGPHPEINGVYGAGPAGQTVIDGDGVIPYQPWALEKK